MRTHHVAWFITLALLVAVVPALAADDAAGRLQRAQELFTAGQYTQAESMAREAIAATTDSTILSGAADVVILCKLGQGDFDGARQAAQELKGEIVDSATQSHLDERITGIDADKASYEQAVAALQATLAANPDNELGASAAYKIAATQLFWNKVSQARDSFQQVTEDFAFSDRALVARLALGGIHEDSNQPGQAETLYEQVILLSPDGPYGAHAVACLKAVLLQQGDVLGAGERMVDIIQAHPDTEASAMAEYCHGEILLFEGQIDEAKAKFDQVAHERHQTIAGGAASIRTAATLISDARTLSDDGDYETAIAKLREVLDLVPGSAYACQARLFIGHNYLWLRNPVSAEPEYAGVVEGFPDSAEAIEARYYTAYCHTQTDPEKAIEELGAVLESDPAPRRLVRAQMMLAGCYLYQKEYQKALDVMDVVLEDTRPQFVEWHDDAEVFRAEVYHIQGQDAQAVAALRSVMSKYADSPTAQYAQELIDKIGGAQ